MKKLLDIFKDLLKFARYMIPVIFFIAVAYTFYLRFTKMDAEQTVEDIIYITTRIREDRQETVFRNFNNDTVVYGGFLPIDIKTRPSDIGYIIKNRFGSDMFFRDSYKTKDERDYYVSLSKRYEDYSPFYQGVGAYTITFSNLKRRACMLLAQEDWKKAVPNFFGMEVGAVTEQEPNNGWEKLNQGLLVDVNGLDYTGTDNSLVANRPLEFREAFRECKCFIKDNCVVSLKFI